MVGRGRVRYDREINRAASASRYTIIDSLFFDLKAEIRASLVSERVGHLGFDISINY
jgi:hypothetical protein